MSRDLETLAERAESGGIVTTVKSELPTNDPDFVAALTRKRVEAGELNPDGSEREQPVAVAAEPAKKPKDKDDWQAALTAEQKAEVDKLYRDRRAQAREIREVNAKLDDLVRKIDVGGKPSEADRKVVAQALERPKKPDPTMFKGTQEEWARVEEKYEDDLFEYRKALEAQDAARRESEQSQKTTVDKFNAEVERIVATPEYADYEATMDDATNEVSDLMFGAIMTQGPQLGYFFAKNPEISAKIARMPQARAVKAIMRVVIRLEADGKAVADEDAELLGPRKARAAAEDEEDLKKKNKRPIIPAAIPRGGGPAAPKRETFKEKERRLFREGKLGYDPG